jgi:hypothetical protein
MQSKKMSLVEVTASTLTGYVIALGTQSVIFPAFGIYISIGESALIALMFTLISIIRSYLFRRLFNYLTTRRIK